MQTVFPLSLVPLMNNDWIVGCGVKCQLSVCQYVTCHFDRSGFPPSFLSLSICFCEGVYTASMRRHSTAGTIKKTHRSFPFLMLCRWHAQHLAQLFLFPLSWRIAYVHIFFRCPLHSGEDYSACPSVTVRPLHVCLTSLTSNRHPNLLVFWRGPQVWLSSILWTFWVLIAVHRRSTRWPTPSYFLFPSSSIPGSSELSPVRKELPVVLCCFWLAKPQLWPFPSRRAMD